MDFRPDQIQVYDLPEFTTDTPEPAEDEEESESAGQDLFAEDTEDEGGPPPVDPGAGFNPAVFETGTRDQAGKVIEIKEEAVNEEDEMIATSERFSSTEFTVETTLLTNSENYAETIREGARIYSERMHKEADDIHQKAEDVLKEAEAIKQAAEEEKNKLIAEAEAQVESIKDTAYQEGLAAGQISGTDLRYKELEPQVAQINDLIEQLSRLRQIIRFQGEQELLQLATLIAKKVVYEELTVNPEVLYNITRLSIQEIESLGKIRILVHPDDYDFLVNAKAKLEQYIKEEQTLVIRPNIDAEPGGILIETDETIINFHFQKQFEHIEEVLSRALNERQSHLHSVDMDAHDFSLPPTEAATEDELPET
ncbi:MAG: hypothetical protein HQM14_08305 [SAR324 cluster bacterium]|nr:hypothetical protein [SAR324 cluster bacterium]